MEAIYTDAIQSQSSTQNVEAKIPKYFSELQITSEPIDVVGRIGSYVNFCTRVQANKPRYQWFDKNGTPMPRMCQSNLTIGPIKEKDFGFYRLQITDELTKQSVLTRWTELKRVQSVIKSDVVRYQQIEHNMFRTEPLTQYAPFQAHRQPTQSMHQYYTQQQPMTPRLLIAPEGGAYALESRVELIAHFENATHYQWYKDGVKLEGCTGNTLVITNANLNNTGDYDLVAFNAIGSNLVKTRVIIH